METFAANNRTAAATWLLLLESLALAHVFA